MKQVKINFTFFQIGGGLSGGYWALFRLELPACYHINLGIFWGVWFYSEFFFVKNKTLPRSNQFQKIQWKVLFFTFLNTDRNAPIFFFDQKYGHSHFKSALKINFRLREVVKLKLHVYAITCIFSLTTSRSQKLISKADLK